MRVVAPWLWCCFFLVLIWRGIIYWADHVIAHYKIPVSCMTSQLHYHQDKKTIVMLGNSLLEAAFPASVLTHPDLKDRVAVVTRPGMTIDDLDFFGEAFQNQKVDVVAIQDTVFRHTKKKAYEKKRTDKAITLMAERFVRFEVTKLLGTPPVCGKELAYVQKLLAVMERTNNKSQEIFATSKIKVLKQRYQKMAEMGISEKAIVMVKQAIESGVSVIVYEIPRSIKVPEERIKKNWRSLLKDTLEPYGVRFDEVGIPLDPRYYRDISHVNSAGGLKLEPYFEKFLTEALK